MTIYPPPGSNENVSPIAAIVGPHTQLGAPSGIAVLKSAQVASATPSANATPIAAPTPAPVGPKPLAVAPRNINFGKVKKGALSKPQKVTLTNQDKKAVTIEGNGLAGSDPSEFNFCGCCVGPLAPRHRCVLKVTFVPAAEGPASAHLQITSNTPRSPETVKLSGKGK